MPERRWWRPRRAVGGKEEAGAAPPDGPAAPPPEELRRSRLYRAADCYLRAGEPVEAARCLALAGEHDRAARLFLQAGDYPSAARACADAEDAVTSAWIHVHHLGDPRTARAMLDGARPLPRTRAEPDLAVYYRPRLARLGDRIGGDSQAAGRPLGQAARQGVGELIRGLLDGPLDAAAATTALAAAGPRKQAAVEARDWPAAYAARELERLLADLRTAHTERARESHQRTVERASDPFARRQAYARCDVAEGITGPPVLRVLAETRAALEDARAGYLPERAEAWGVAIAEAMRRYDQAALIFAAAVRGRQPGAAARWREWSRRALLAEVVIPVSAEVA